MKRKTVPISAALFLGVVGASLAWAGSQTFQLTSPGNNIVLDGIYMSPYTALIGGVPTTVICDDFADEVALNETWQTTMSTVASLAPNVRWATDPAVSGYNEQQSYNEAAWLAGQLLGSSDPTQMGQISYAIWAVFDPTGVSNWLNGVTSPYNDPTTYSAVFGSGGLLAQAASQSYSAGQFSNISVYTPTGAPPGYSMPQEFLVRTPEASALTILGSDFACLGLFVVFFRRRLAAKIS
jgi:hypothetical protein